MSLEDGNLRLDGRADEVAGEIIENPEHLFFSGMEFMIGLYCKSKNSPCFGKGFPRINRVI